MKLFNSRTRSEEEFIPKNDTVTMYTCGPTVYNYAHIGNLRSYIMEDILEKYLVYSGYDVRRAMNITDVGHLTGDGDDGEDRMMLGAKREKMSVLDLAAHYTAAFFADFEKLNIKKPPIVVPATSRVDDYIEMIETLLAKGYAYAAGGNVYFDTSRLETYFVFARHNAEDLETGVREGVGKDPNKKNPNDFVLWFTKSKFENQELQWDSPWGYGYPGWHIECSAISVKELGRHLDIHCGGIDNAFPHHTNEIAQTEAYLGHPWCNFWFHVRHLHDETGKMSKSKGGFITVSFLEEEGYDPLAYRYFCLMSHYRKNLSFTWETLKNAAASYEKLIARLSRLDENDKTCEKDAFQRHQKAFHQALSADLNTSLALTALYDVLKDDIPDGTKRALAASFDQVLSLDLLKKAAEYAKGGADRAGTKKAEEIDALVEARKKAKEEKDYAKADRIRQHLKDMGVRLEDTPGGTKWFYL